MTKVLKSYTSDYKISVKDEGTITLDTGPSPGKVRVTGDLIIEGDTTTVNTTDLEIEDNTILLNKNDGSTAGVMLGTSGIEIDRGGLLNARWVFDESVSWTLGGLSGQGTFYAEEGKNGQKLPINTPGIVAQGDFYVTTGNGVISVTNTANYEEKIFNYENGFIQPSANGLLVIDDDNIPNTKAVKDYVDFTFTNRAPVFISEGDTRVETVDENHPLLDIELVETSNNQVVIQTTGQHGFTEFDTVDISGVEANGDPIENLNGTNIAILEVINANLVRLDANIPNGDATNYIENSGTISKTGYQESRVKIDVEGINIADFYNNRFNIDGIEITNTTIQTTASNEDLVLKAPGVGSVRVDDILEIPAIPYDDDVSTVDPLSPEIGVKLYSKPAGTGKTGLYYVNSNSVQDEFISKNRSLLFSMLF